EPAVRIRAALRHLLADWAGYGRHAVTVAQRDSGGWEVPGAIEKIKAIATHANVPFNDARQALFDYLKAELGDVMDRVVFPPQDRRLSQARDRRWTDGAPRSLPPRRAVATTTIPPARQTGATAPGTRRGRRDRGAPRADDGGTGRTATRTCLPCGGGCLTTSG